MAAASCLNSSRPRCCERTWSVSASLPKNAAAVEACASSVRCRSQSQTLQDPSPLRQNPNLPSFRSVVGGSATNGYTSPSTPTPSCLRQLGSPSYVIHVSGVLTSPSAPTPTPLVCDSLALPFMRMMKACLQCVKWPRSDYDSFLSVHAKQGF